MDSVMEDESEIEDIKCKRKKERSKDKKQWRKKEGK